MPRFRPLAVTLLVSTLAAAVRAEAQTVDLRLATLEELMAIEVTSASRREQRAEDVPAAVYVITHDDIRRSGLTSIPELLRLAPSVHVARINSNRWAVSVRGFNGRLYSIDRGDLLQRLSGDEQLAADVVRLFVGECPALVDAVGSALTKRDVEAVRRTAHTLKGSASSASARGVADAARTLETLAAEGQIEALDDAWARLSQEAAMVLQGRPLWAASSKENACEP